MTTSRTALLGCATTILLLLTALPSPVSATNDPPCGGGTVNGNWLVDGTTGCGRTWTSVTITVRGNIIISTKLTLRDVTLIMDDSNGGNGTRAIVVNAGGELVVDDLDGNNATTGDGSLITSVNENGNHRFVFIAVGKLTIRNSEIRQAGFASGNIINWGLLVLGDASTVTRNVFKDTYTGTGVISGGAPVQNANVSGNTYTGTLFIDTFALNANNTTFRDNTYAQPAAGAPLAAIYGSSASNFTVVNNTMGTRLLGIYADAGSRDLLFQKNTMTNQGWAGIAVNDTTNLTIADNTITTVIAGYGIYVNASSTVTLSGNVISATASFGAYVGVSDTVDIAGNTIQNSAGGDGLILQLVATGTMSGNTITGSAGNGVYIDASTGITSTGDSISGSGASGIGITGSTGVMIFGGDIGTNGDYGVLAEASSAGIWVENSSMVGNTITDLAANASSDLTSLNSTFTTTQTSNGATLTVLWYLHAQVMDSLGAPAPGATVTLRDAGASLLDTKTTDVAGMAEWFIATGFVETAAGRDFSANDHVLRADKGPINGTVATNASSTKTVTILMNRAPADNGSPTELRFVEDANATLDLRTVFTDEDPVAFAVVPAANLLAGLSPAGVVTVSAPVDWSGSTSLLISAKDTHNLYTNRTLPVVVTPLNDAPVIVAPVLDIAVDEDAGPFKLNLTDLGTDVDTPYGDSFTWYLTGESTGLYTLTGENTSEVLVFTFVANASGTDDVTLVLEDGAGAQASVPMAITVRPVNDAPWFTSTPVAKGIVGSNYTYAAAASDIDVGDTLEFSVVSGPQGLTINATSGLVSWAPDDGQEGNRTVTIAVGDGHGGKANQTFVIDVAHRPNRPPSFTSSPVLEAITREPFRYLLTAIDPDHDNLTFALVAGPTGMTLGNDSALNWTPADAQAGLQEVTVSVFDGKLTVTQTFKVDLAPGKRPGLAVATPVDGAKLTAGKITLNGTATAGTSPIDRIEIVIDGGTAIKADGTSSWSLAWTAKPGKHTIVVRAFDTRGRVTETTLSVTVKAAPTIGVGGSLAWLLVIIAVVAAVAVVGLLMAKKRRGPPAEERPAPLASDGGISPAPETATPAPVPHAPGGAGTAVPETPAAPQPAEDWPATPSEPPATHSPAGPPADAPGSSGTPGGPP